MEKRVLTLKEAAATLGMSVPWMYLKIQAGEIASVRMGRRLKITAEEVERILREGVQ